MFDDEKNSTHIYKTKSQILADSLRESIISGKLKAGQKITLTSFAKTYNVSEIPLREALKSLEKEGMVEIVPYSGAVVSKITYNDLKQIYLLRSYLEEYAIKLAVPKACENDIKTMRELVDNMKVCVDEENYKKYSAINKEFHLFIYAIPRFNKLYDFITDLWNITERFRYVPDSIDRLHRSFDNHQKLLTAFEKKDVDAALSIIYLHKQKAMEYIKAKHFIDEKEV